MNKHLAGQWSLRLFLAGITTLALTGCVGVIPLPTTSKVLHGQKLADTQTSFIQPGRTTRAQLIAELGTNYITFPRCSSIAYTWELQGGGGVWWTVIALPDAGYAEAGGWAGGWRGFFVAFDDREIVRAAEFKKLSTRHSLCENMDSWMAGLAELPSSSGR